jgi:hypothetical protein
MICRIAADLVALLHFGFILFVLAGGTLVFRNRSAVFVHLPAAVWGTVIEWKGWVCPLTPLENRLRALGGETPYTGDFIDRYLLPVIYPEGLTRNIQFLLGAIVLVSNLLIYGYYLYRQKRPS